MLTAGDYKFITGADVDATHPHGDLDGIILDGAVYPRRADKRIIRGEDLTFAAEAAYERRLLWRKIGFPEKPYVDLDGRTRQPYEIANEPYGSRVFKNVIAHDPSPYGGDVSFRGVAHTLRMLKESSHTLYYASDPLPSSLTAIPNPRDGLLEYIRSTYPPVNTDPPAGLFSGNVLKGSDVSSLYGSLLRAKTLVVVCDDDDPYTSMPKYSYLIDSSGAYPPSTSPYFGWEANASYDSDTGRKTSWQQCYYVFDYRSAEAPNAYGLEYLTSVEAASVTLRYYISAVYRNSDGAWDDYRFITGPQPMGLPTSETLLRSVFSAMGVRWMPPGTLPGGGYVYYRIHVHRMEPILTLNLGNHTSL